MPGDEKDMHGAAWRSYGIAKRRGGNEERRSGPQRNSYDVQGKCKDVNGDGRAMMGAEKEMSGKEQQQRRKARNSSEKEMLSGAGEMLSGVKQSGVKEVRHMTVWIVRKIVTDGRGTIFNATVGANDKLPKAIAIAEKEYLRSFRRLPEGYMCSEMSVTEFSENALFDRFFNKGTEYIRIQVFVYSVEVNILE